MILIAYDGSPDATAAIQRAGELMRDEPATVLTVWDPMALILARSPGGLGPMAGLVAMQETDDALRRQAEHTVAEGAALARRAGLDATGHCRARETTMATAILDEAERVGASAIVMGSRGLTGLKSLLMGSVSHGVLHHADRPVVVVPSPEVATSRLRARHALHGG